MDFGTEPYLVTLGDHVSATNTQFVTHDGGVWIFRDKVVDMDKIAPIKVGNNVFFGTGAIVLPGVTIGENVIIGAGAVVAKDIRSNCVAVGIPAQPIESIDEYLESNKDNLLKTKGLSRTEKKKYLLRHFNMNAMM